MLFNAEPDFWHDGFPEPMLGYFNTYMDKEKRKCIELNKEKYGASFNFALNAGVFLGEKKFMLDILTKTLEFMNDDYKKGFPYGCHDDQSLLRYIHNNHFDDICADIFNEFSFWGCGHRKVAV